MRSALEQRTHTLKNLQKYLRAGFGEKTHLRCWKAGSSIWVHLNQQMLHNKLLQVNILSPAIHPTLTVIAEHVGHELALRFASKCFSPLELSHLKDNFKTLADQTDGVKYWKEETLCRFLCLPDAIGAGPIIYQMASNLGAFPFPSLAPSILTLEAMVKVIVIMTERYSRILKRGRRDRIKLLFRSLAVFDRRLSAAAPSNEKPSMQQLVTDQKPDDMVNEEAAGKENSHIMGFAVDEPVEDLDEDEDDDELALAALDSLDAIEVFKVDQKQDRKINHARIPVDNFRRLVTLLLALAPLEPQDNIARFAETLTDAKVKQLSAEADNIIATFEPEPNAGGITYRKFTRAIMSSFPYLFEPLNCLFEHFLFSKNLDLSKRRDAASANSEVPPLMPPTPSPIVSNSANEESLLTDAMLSHISTFLVTSPATPSLYHAHTQFHPLYSTSRDGTSLTSFQRQVISWQSPTLLILTGTTSSPLLPQVTIGAYIPFPWSKQPETPSTSPHETPCLFILHPRHAVFASNAYHRPSQHSHTTSSAPFTHFSTKTGISIGCIIPPSSRTHQVQPVPGPISLQIETDVSTATFTYTPDEGTGAFLPDPTLPVATKGQASTSGPVQIPPHVTIDISTLAIYGLSTPSPDADGEDELTRQKKRLAWDEAEAERRRGVNFGGDQEGARALLEMAGIVGGHGSRSGGSV